MKQERQDQIIEAVHEFNKRFQRTGYANLVYRGHIFSEEVFEVLVSWPSIGAVGTDEAEQFTKSMGRATEFAKKLNFLAKHEDVPFETYLGVIQ